MIVAGIGFREAAAADEIVALVERALGEARLAPGALEALATASALAARPAFREAAGRLAARPIAVDAAALAATAPRLATRSARSLAAHGVGSVAEAAALGAAGEGAALLLPRIASAGATCALAGDRP